MHKRRPPPQTRKVEPIEQFQNVQMKMIKEARRWERHEGQLMRYHRSRWHPVTWEDEQELREILYQIIEKTDGMLVAFFGEEPKWREV